MASYGVRLYVLRSLRMEHDHEVSAQTVTLSVLSKLTADDDYNTRSADM